MDRLDEGPHARVSYELLRSALEGSNVQVSLQPKSLRFVVSSAGLLCACGGNINPISATELLNSQEPPRQLFCSTFLRVVDDDIFGGSGPSKEDFSACRHQLSALGLLTVQCRPTDEFSAQATCEPVGGGLGHPVSIPTHSRTRIVGGVLFVECGRAPKHATRVSAAKGPNPQVDIEYSELAEADQELVRRIAPCSPQPYLDLRSGRKAAERTSRGWRLVR